MSCLNNLDVQELFFYISYDLFDQGHNLLDRDYDLVLDLKGSVKTQIFNVSTLLTTVQYGNFRFQL